MVVEAAVLVVGNNERRAAPVRAVEERGVGLQHELLSGVNVGRGVIVVRPGWTDEGDVVEVRVDPGDGRKLSVSGVVDEIARRHDALLVEIGEL
jgi:hypothetical protein